MYFFILINFFLKVSLRLFFFYFVFKFYRLFFFLFAVLIRYFSKVIQSLCAFFVYFFFYFVLYLFFIFDKNLNFYQFFITVDFFSPIFSFFFHFFYDFTYFLSFFYVPFGVDGISLPLLLLTTFIFPICFRLIVVSFSKAYINLIFFWLFCLEIFLIIAFSVLDVFYFYMFFEATLLPMFLFIGFGGFRFRKIKASFYLFFYTFAGSIFMLIGILSIFFSIGSTFFEDVFSFSYSQSHQRFLWVCFFLTFAVKVPMLPFHIWLPEAHVEAPTVGSIILASILLKLGGFGFFRFSLSLFPNACFFFSPFVLTLALSGVIYASMVTMRQIDIKRIIAYSSIAHMNMAILGIFSLNFSGLFGSFYLMLGHGIVSTALFFSIGVLYDRYHTRLLFYFGGLTSVMPVFSFFFLFFSFSNIGFPGTVNFISEFFILKGLVFFNGFTLIFSFLGVFLSIVYSFFLYNRIMLGTLKSTYISRFSDVNQKEFLLSFIFFFFVLIFGVDVHFLSDIFIISFIKHYFILIY